jgi:hypothetical protein
MALDDKKLITFKVISDPRKILFYNSKNSKKRKHLELNIKKPIGRITYLFLLIAYSTRQINNLILLSMFTYLFPSKRVPLYLSYSIVVLI